MRLLRTFLLRVWAVCVLSLIGCGSEPRALQQPGPGPDLTQVAAADPNRPDHDPALRAAYIEARQAEVATDPSYALTEAMGSSTTLQARGDARAVSHRAISAAKRTQTEFIADGSVRLSPVGPADEVADRGFELKLARWGQQTALTEAPAIRERTARGNRIELARGAITEWYVNGPLGLEQGFTIAQAPQPGAEKLVLELEVQGAQARLDAGGRAVTFMQGEGTSIGGYSDLFVKDARGKHLNATLFALDDKIRISVDTRDAAFPVVVDPLVWLEQRLVRTAGEVNGYFGHAVAVDGDFAIVGAYYNGGLLDHLGHAYIFARDGSAWIQEAKLDSPGGAVSDEFGTAVAISGELALVGAPRADNPSGQDSGAVYAYTRSGGGWTVVKIVPAVAPAGAAFGGAVALDGETALILSGEGAHVFDHSGGTWEEGPTLRPWDGVDSWQSVAVEGDLAVLGAPLDDTAGLDVGSAYVFSRAESPESSWVPQVKLLPTVTTANQRFGSAVASSSDLILVGAPGANAGVGNAYVFTREGSSWIAYPIQPADAVQRSFGSALAISGERAIIGAYQNGAGAVYSFIRTPAGWTQQQKITSPSPNTGDYFGGDVALSGDVAFIGALYDDIGGSSSGAAYAFSHDGSTWTERQALLPGSEEPYDAFGYSVAVDGNTAVVGAPYRDDNGAYSGAAWAFFRSNGVWKQQGKLLPTDGAASGNFGWSVGVSGNYAVVARLGSAYIFFRSGATWSQQAKLLPGDGMAGFGKAAVAIDGDTAVVGANSDGASTGAAFAFTRSGVIWTQQQKVVPADTALGFGRTIDIEGNTLVVGGMHSDVVLGTYTGATYAFTRSGSVWSQQQKLLPTDATTNVFGRSVALSGETVLVGAARISSGNWVSSAYAFTRSGSIWTQQHKFLQGSATSGFAGQVALSGDIALIAEPEADGGLGLDTGAALVFRRSGGIWSAAGSVASASGKAYSRLGRALAMSGSTAIAGTDPNGYSNEVYVFDVLDNAFADGTPCAGDGQCSSSHCVSGICCSDLCDGTCESCLQLLKGDASADGTCGQVASGTICGAPLLECASTTEYKLAPACDPAGDCVPRTAECADGFACVDGLVSSYCAGDCRSGDPLQPQHPRCADDHFCHSSGACQPDKGGGQPCNGNAECMSNVCSGSVCKKSQGEQCGAGSECLSGLFCVDGYCCNEACSGVCDACNLSKPGTCEIIDDTAPVASRCQGSDDQCDGWCDGSSKTECHFPGGACGAATCAPSPNLTVPAEVTGFVCQGGDCEPGATSDCNDYRTCNVAGTNCASSCTSDAHCIQAAFCDTTDSKCKGDRDVSESCTANVQCLSSFCVDGVCCDTACGEQCQACDIAGSVGECTLVPAEQAPHPDGGRRTACTSSGGCIGYCDGVTDDECFYPGGVCGVATCAPSGNLDTAATVTGNVCTAGACTTDGASPCGLRRTCNAAGTDCAPTCQFDVECISGAFCDTTDSTCKGDLPVGTECTRGGQCGSTYCVDGFCCDDFCGGPCEACNIVKLGVEAGTCTPVDAGQPPEHGSCQDAHADCGEGTCDGSSRAECTFEPAPCGAGSCSGATLTRGACTAKGQCQPGGSVEPCGAYECSSATSCRETCSSHGHCSLGYQCDFATSVCVDKLLNGDECTDEEECDSGQCVDGVCCNSACEEQCQACNQPGSEGKCVVVSGTPRGTRAACDAGDHAACAASCDGMALECQYPDQGTPCEGATCSSENVLNLARVCDGSGSCTLGETQDCGAFRCDGSACQAECTSDDDCTAGAVCDTTRNVCGFSDAVCKDLFTLERADGSVSSCAPFICDSGICLRECGGNAECADGYECVASECVEVTTGSAGAGAGGGAGGDEPSDATTTDEGGCGCRAAGAPRAPLSGALTLLAMAALLARRRYGAGATLT